MLYELPVEQKECHSVHRLLRALLHFPGGRVQGSSSEWFHGIRINWPSRTMYPVTRQTVMSQSAMPLSWHVRAA